KLYRVVKPVPSVLRANTVPPRAVPYRVLPDKINRPSGPPRSLPKVKLCRVVKPVPSVLTANTVPQPELPPYDAVPYRVLSDKTKSLGPPPSLLMTLLGSSGPCAVKLCRIVKPVPSVLTLKIVPVAEGP